jgi:hypothetical protein
MRSALFWNVTQRIVVISYRYFGTNYRSHFIGFILNFWKLEDGNDRLCRNVGKDSTESLSVTSHKSADLVYLTAQA